MNSINETTIQQLTRGQGLGALTALIDGRIVTDDSRNAIQLHFRKMVGQSGKKFKTLAIEYNSGTDSYDLKGYKLNKKTFVVDFIALHNDVYCDQLAEVCESLTGLCMHF